MDHTEPLQLAQSLAMSSDITDADRSLLIDMLHELSERRRNDPWFSTVPDRTLS